MPVKNKVGGYYGDPRYDPGEGARKVQTGHEENGCERGEVCPIRRTSRKSMEQPVKHCDGDEKEGRKHKRRE
jgi:hypothetical protein